MKNIRLGYSAILVLAVGIMLSCSSGDNAKPVIESLEPGTGEEGEPVVIKGSLLGSTKSIMFGTTSALVIDAQAGQVTTQVPAGVTEGSVDVTVSNDGGESNKVSFLVLPKSPELPAGTEASITSLVPANSYKGYPIMIRGKNLLQTSKVLFNTTEATIVTKYNSTVTVFVPDLANGTYTIRLVTAENGNTKGTSITILSPPVGYPAPPAANFISPPPANFSATISNQWSIFLLSTGGTTECPLVDLNDETFCGHYTFTKDPVTKAITENFIEFTKDGIEHFYGQWSSPYVVPCIQKIVFISDKDGHLLEATVDVTDFTDGCQ